jgi:photosystem II stability/assembly factor-like uncharacterized protein
VTVAVPTALLKENRMIVRNLTARLCVLLTVVALLGTVGCHRVGVYEPMTEQKIYVSDRYFDVHIMGPKESLIIGYGGKALRTTDAGFTWADVATGTDKALYSIGFAEGDKIGWMVGEEGLVLKTTDGGTSWTPYGGKIWLDPECEEEDERSYRELNEDPCQLASLFSIDVIDENTAHAIGDKSIYTRTRDGGKTWQTETMTVPTTGISADLLLAVEDPVLYDLKFLDHDNGYIVGEFGKIYHTTNGGESWTEQQKTVMDETVLDVFDLPTFFDVEFSDADNGIVTGLDGRIAVTTDGGKDWNFVANNVDDYIDPFYATAILPNGTRWIVGASGQVVKSGADGVFAKGDLHTSVNNWMRRVRFYDDNVGWIVGGFGFVMMTEDGGETWFRRFG